MPQIHQKTIRLKTLENKSPKLNRLHPIMLVGTGSDVGKSVIATALCRIFLQDGYSPAPFKAQNMALNSYATPEGLEIGRAQAVQAEAARVPCHTDMNPLLLKPNSEHTTQVVLNGKRSETARHTTISARRGERNCDMQFARLSTVSRQDTIL